MTVAIPKPPSSDGKATRQDFVSDQELRWCPGCGDYAILAQMQRVMAELGLDRDQVVFISGIGCASRFPYYMNVYGFHTIHGRGPTIVTGLKAINPDLQVWLITGDGDALSIGGNHLMHCLRRNVNVKILLFNNRIYGLTKGQSSPTSPRGTKTKSTPDGSIDNPVEPIRFAVASRASFVARTIDTHTQHMSEILLRAAQHEGCAFIEVYQNCVVFNDKAFAHFTDRGVRPEKTLDLKHGEKLLFGRDRERGLIFNGSTFEVVEADHPDVLVHDESRYDSTIIYGLARLRYPDYPVPIGVFRDIHTGSYAHTFEELLGRQVTEARKQRKGDLQALIDGPNTWVVK